MLLMMWRLLGKWRKICAFSKIRFCAIPAPAFNHLGFCPWLCLLGSTPLLGRIANHNGEQTWEIQTDIWDQLYMGSCMLTIKMISKATDTKLRILVHFGLKATWLC